MQDNSKGKSDHVPSLRRTETGDAASCDSVTCDRDHGQYT